MCCKLTFVTLRVFESGARVSKGGAMALAGPIMGTPLLGGAEHPTRHNRQFQEHAGVRVGYRCSLLAAEEVL